MTRWTIAALAALAVPLAVSAGEGKQATEQSSSRSEPSATSSSGKTDPTYGGYSTDPGTEARSEAKQASDPDRKKSRAKQDKGTTASDDRGDRSSERSASKKSRSDDARSSDSGSSAAGTSKASSSRPENTSTDGKRDPTYGGYSTDPGTEARSDAKQASDPGREKSTAKQDEQGGEPSSASGASIARQPPAVTDNARRDAERMDGTDSGSEESGRSSSREGSTSGEKSTGER
jgi:hypothetical protein